MQGSPPEVIRLFHLLRRLPEDVVVSQRLPTLHGPGPDFWLARQDRVLFLAVSAVTPQEAARAGQMGLFGGGGRPIGEGEGERLAAFSHSIAHIPHLPAAILFPNLNGQQMAAAMAATKPAANGRVWVSKETLTPDRFADWLNGRLSDPLTPAQIGGIREKFTPEVVVPAAFTVRQPIERHTKAELGQYLLDYDQEYALKLDLNLPDAGQTTAQDFKLRLINGVAGSGKSLIVIYRAHMLRQLFPRKRILILTHNRALIHDLRRRYVHLSGGDRGVQLYTFLGWCRRHWPKDKVWRKTIGYRARLALAAQISHEHLGDTAVSEQMLLEEIDWTKDRLIFSRDDYLAADRAGRGFALGESMRHRLYDAMTAYHEALQQRQLMDWGDVPRQIWRFWHNGEATLPRYDIILIDEAQFFAPLWFEIIKRILTPDTGHLFLVADASQGFLKRGQSWLSSGLDVRGRVHRLQKSYRTTREILDFATLLYRTRLPQEDEEIVAPDVAHMPNGVLPVVIPLTSAQDEVTRVINEIRQLAKGGVPWGHILIIHASREEVRSILQRLHRIVAIGAHRTRRADFFTVQIDRILQGNYRCQQGVPLDANIEN